MLATTACDLNFHTRRADVSYNNMPQAGPSSPISPLASPLSSPSYDRDFERRGSFGDEEDEHNERALAKQRECARRVAAWITQSAVRITAITTPYGASKAASFDLLDFDLEEEDDEDIGEDGNCIPEPFLFYSSSSSSNSKPAAPVIHAPIPRRRSGRRHHGHLRPRIPSPLYVIPEEDSE